MSVLYKGSLESSDRRKFLKALASGTISRAGMKALFYIFIMLIAYYSSLAAQEDEGSAGFDHGFYIQNADGSFVFHPFGLIHTDLHIINDGTQINVDETQASTFLLRRARLGFEGLMYKKIDYALETNVGEGGAELIFAWMNFRNVQKAQVRVGQFKEPFSYEVLLPEKYLDFIERSIVATVISPAEDIGIMVHNFGSPAGGFFEYGIGMFNGVGASAEKKDPDKSFEYVGRISIYPFTALSNGLLKGFRIAGYGLYEGNRPEGVDIRPRTPLGFEFVPRIPTSGRRLALGGDVQLVHGSFSAKAEYIRNLEQRFNAGALVSQNPDAVIEGWHVDYTYLLTGEDKVQAMQKGLEATARIEQLRIDAGLPMTLVDYVDKLGNPIVLQKNHVTTLTIGLNHYLNYNVKFQLNYQNDWFGNKMFTPTSRLGNILKSSASPRGKVLARVQLYF